MRSAFASSIRFGLTVLLSFSVVGATSQAPEDDVVAKAQRKLTLASQVGEMENAELAKSSEYQKMVTTRDEADKKYKTLLDAELVKRKESPEVKALEAQVVEAEKQVGAAKSASESADAALADVNRKAGVVKQTASRLQNDLKQAVKTISTRERALNAAVREEEEALKEKKNPPTKSKLERLRADVVEKQAALDQAQADKTTLDKQVADAESEYAALGVDGLRKSSTDAKDKLRDAQQKARQAENARLAAEVKWKEQFDQQESVRPVAQARVAAIDAANQARASVVAKMRTDNAEYAKLAKELEALEKK